jgi:hypothetical protein
MNSVAAPGRRWDHADAEVQDSSGSLENLARKGDDHEALCVWMRPSD